MATLSAPPSTADHGGSVFAKTIPDKTGLAEFRKLINADVLDAWYDPSPNVIRAVSDSIGWMCRTSPPTFSAGLTHVLEEARGVRADCALFGGGSSELIHLVARHVLGKDCRVAILDPMYGEYAHVLDAIRADVRTLTLHPESGFAPDLDALSELAHNCDAVVIVNPNNPTGYCLSAGAIVALRKSMPTHAWLIVDETYIDFVDGAEPLERHVASLPNTIVIKSMSKFYALSGLRVGYLVSRPATIRRLSTFVPPWSVSLPAQVAAVEALRDEAYYEQKAIETNDLRRAMVASLREIRGLEVWEGAANYVLMCSTQSASDVCRSAASDGVLLRHCGTQGESMGDRFFRTAVKDATSNERIVGAIRDSVS